MVVLGSLASRVLVAFFCRSLAREAAVFVNLQKEMCGREQLREMATSREQERPAGACCGEFSLVDDLVLLLLLLSV